MQKSHAREDTKYHNSVECFHLLNLTSDYKQVIEYASAEKESQTTFTEQDSTNEKAMS